MSSFQKIFFAFIVCGSFIWQPQGLLAQKNDGTEFEDVDLGSEPSAPPPAYDDVVSPQQGQKQSWGDMFKSWGKKINPFRPGMDRSFLPNP